MTSPTTTLIRRRNVDATLKAVKAQEQQFLLDKYGPPPLNPFKELRNQHGLSIEGLANHSHISKSAIVRAEKGTYNNPLPSLTDYWLGHSKLDLTYLDLMSRYDEFQSEQRKRHSYYFGPSLFSLAGGPSTTHPLRELRRARPPAYFTHSSTNNADVLRSLTSDELAPVGLSEVSSALCLPIDSLQYWEKKWRQQQTVPKLFNKVLRVIGYDTEEIVYFNATYEQWRADTLAAERRLRNERAGK